MAFTPNSRNWRFYENDASEPVTPLEAENTAPDVEDGTEFRLRWQIHETGNAGGNNLTFSFQYYYDSTWTDCSGGSAHFIPYSGLGSEGSLITSFKLTDSDTEGEYTTSNSNVDSIAKNDYHEFDMCLVSVPGNSVPSTSYQFRVLLDSNPVGLESTAYDYPTCTVVAAAAEINMGTAGAAGSAPTITLDVPVNITTATAAVTATSPTLTVEAISEACVGAWYMEEASGNDRADSSSSGNDLSEVGGNIPQETTYYKQGSASAGSFASVPGFLARDDADLSSGFPAKNGSSNNHFTCGGWVRWDSTGAMNVMVKGTTIFIRKTDSEGFYCYINADPSQQSVTGSTTGLNTDTWYHVVTRWDPTTDGNLRLFLGGNSDGYASISGYDLEGNTGNLRVGGGSPYLSGFADEVFFFNYALSDSDISNIFTNGLEAFLAGVIPISMGVAGVVATAGAATINRPVVAGVAAVTATVPAITVEAIAEISMGVAGVVATSPAITIDAPVNVTATSASSVATSPALTIEAPANIDMGTASVVATSGAIGVEAIPAVSMAAVGVVATSPAITLDAPVNITVTSASAVATSGAISISAGPNVSMGVAGVVATSGALTIERPVVMAAASVSGSVPTMSVVIPNASLFKLMMHATGSQISDLKVAIVDDGTYPEIDGLILNIQTSTQKTEAQAIAAERPNMRIWRYVELLNYPFSIGAGLSQHEVWNLKRGSLQFMANTPGAATRQRMVTTSSPYEAALFYAYCVTSPEDEFREMIHWYGINSTLADNFVDGLADLCDDISADCAVFMDQSWMRILDWMVTDPTSGDCAPVTWQSGHGETCDETDKYPGSDYATMAALYGANNWRTWYNNQAYFWAAIDAAVPTDSWNIRNGDFRIDHAQNYDSGLGTYRNLPMPIMIEDPHDNILLTQLYPSYNEAQRFQAALDFWMQDSRNLLGIFYAGESYKLDDAKDAWTQNTGGWISLLSSGLATPPTDTQMVEALEELITWRESFAVGINCSTAAATATAEQVTPYMGTVVNAGTAAVTSTAPTLAVDAGPQINMGTAAVGATAEALSIDAPVNLTMTSASAIITGQTITLDVPALVNMAVAEAVATAEDLSIATNVDLLMAMASVTATAPALGGEEGMAGRGYGYLARPRPAPRARPVPVYGVRGRR